MTDLSKSKGRDRAQLIQSKKERLKINDTSIQGEITSVVYRNGPVKERKATDLFGCFVYLLFVGFGVFIVVAAISDGNLYKIRNGYDSDNNACGVGKLHNFKYLYFGKLDNLAHTACVSKCPVNNLDVIKCFENSVIEKCSDLTVYPSEKYLDITCSPLDKTIKNKVSKAIKLPIHTIYTNVIEKNMLIYAFGIIFPLGLGIFFLLLMLFIPKIVTWLFIILSIMIVLCFASLFMILFADPGLLVSVGENNGLDMSSLDLLTDELKLGISITLFIISTISLVLLFFFYKKIMFAVAFMESTSLFLKSVWSALILPFIFIFIFGVYILFSIFILLSLFSMGDPIESSDLPNFGKVRPSDQSIILMAFYFFIMLWNLSFIVHTYHWILSSSCVFWYYSDDKEEHQEENKESGPSFKEKMKDKMTKIWDAIKEKLKRNKKELTEEEKLEIRRQNKAELDRRAKIKDKQKTFLCFTYTPREKPYDFFLLKGLSLYFRYHIGSVAIGSLNILLFGFFNSTFGFIYNKLAYLRDNTTNSFLAAFLKSMLFCCYCYDSFIRYLTKNAFVQMTITGCNFFTSSKDSFLLIHRSYNKYAMVEGMGNVILFLGKLFICLATLLSSFLILLQSGMFNSTLENSFESSLIVLFISMICSYLVMILYDSVNDAMLVSYLLDEEIEINHYGRDTPFHAPEPLKKFIKDRSNQIAIK